MIEKTLPVPACAFENLRFDVEGLRNGGLLSNVLLLHMKEKNGALVCAESTVPVYALASAVSRIFCTESEVYGQTGKKLYVLGEGTTRNGYNPLYRIITYPDDFNSYYTICCASGRTYLVKPTTAAIVSTTMGGTCMKIFHERLFLGDGMKINYSAPLYYERMTDQRTQYAGQIIIPPDGKGDIVDLIVRGDNLYFLRERGITRLTGQANTLNFRLRNMPYEHGAILRESVADCGDNAYFFTENGLFRFDGETCAKVKDAQDEGIDLTAPVWAVNCGTEYYASVMKDGKRIIYVYSRETGRGRFINVENDMIAGCGDVYYLKDLEVGILTDYSLPSGGGECSLSFHVEVPKKEVGVPYLESFTVEGSGSFRLMLNGVTYEVTAGTSMRLSKALRGREFSFKICAKSRYFQIDGFSMRIRRDAA